MNRLDFVSGNVEIKEAIAFNFDSRPVKCDPKVTLVVADHTTLKIKDRYIMWRFLDNLDNEKFHYNSYLNVINEVPLEVIINDFLHDYPNTLIRAWVDEDNYIVGFDGSKKHNPKETQQTMREIAEYINATIPIGYTEEQGEWDYQVRLVPYRAKEGLFTGLVASYIQGNKIIEIISKYQANKHNVIISCRYSAGIGCIQPIESRAFDGRLSTLPVADVYGQIDTLIAGLKVLDEQYIPTKNKVALSNMSYQMYLLNIEDRNKLENERFRELI